MILLALGAVGDYVARTYEETKSRPLYVLSATCNVPQSQNVLSRVVMLSEPRPLATASMPDELPLEVVTAEEPSFSSLAGIRV
jgi:hypothetical protein